MAALQAWELIHDLFGAKPLIELATNDILVPEEAQQLYRAEFHARRNSMD